MHYKTVIGLAFLACFIHSSSALAGPHYSVVCLESNTSISLSSDNLTSLEASGNDRVIIHPNFTYDDVSSPCSSPLNHPHFTLQLHECYPHIWVTPECIYFTWTVRALSAVTQPVSRFNDVCFNVTCKFNRTQLLSSTKITPQVRKRILTAVTRTVNFNLSLALYNDTAFQNRFATGDSIVVNRLFYAQVTLNNVAFAPARYIVQIMRCWATTTSSPDSSPSYPLIMGSCPANNYITIIRNYLSQTGSFSVSSFAWVTNNSLPIYVHCVVQVCDSEAPSANCTGPSCPVSRRRRRDIDSSDQRILSYGPINLTPDDAAPTCLENNGGCSDICSIENNKILCSCPFGSALQENGKTCADEGIILQIINSSSGDHYSTIIVALLLMNFCVLIALVYTGRQKSLKTVV